MPLVRVPLLVLVLVASACTGSSLEPDDPNGTPPATAAISMPPSTETAPSPTTSLSQRFTWTREELHGLELDNPEPRAVAIATAGAEAIMVGSQPIDESFQPMIWRSARGDNWDIDPLPRTIGQGEPRAVAHLDGTTVVVGSRPTGVGTRSPFVATSEGRDGFRRQDETMEGGLALDQVAAAPDVGFLASGLTDGQRTFLVSPNGVDWSSATDLDRSWDALDGPSLAVIRGGSAGIVAVAEVIEGGRNVAVVFQSDRDGSFDEVARLDDGSDVMVSGAEVTDDAVLLFGGVRNDTTMEPAAWRRADDTEFVPLDLDIRLDEGHNAVSTAGGWFTDAVSVGNGLVGRVFMAASTLFVRSEDARAWTEIPNESGIRDTEFPDVDDWSVLDDRVIAIGGSSSNPAVWTIDNRVTQVLDSDLPAPTDAVEVVEVSAEPRLTIVGERVARAQDVTTTESRRLEVVTSGSASPATLPTPGSIVSDAVISGDGQTVIVGYDQFLDRFVNGDGIRPRQWTHDAGVVEAVEGRLDYPGDGASMRMFLVDRVDGAFVAAGSWFPNGGATSALLFFHSPDGRQWEVVSPTGSASLSNAHPRMLCPLPDGGALALVEWDRPEGTATAVWTTRNGRAWTLVDRVSDTFGAVETTVTDCDLRSDELILTGSGGQPKSATLWTTTEGSSVQSVTLESLGDDSELLDADVTDDGRLIALATADATGSPRRSLVELSTDDRVSEVTNLEIASLADADGDATPERVLVQGNDVLLIDGWSSGVAAFRSPLPPPS